MLDNFYREPCNYQSRIEYSTLIQNVILKEIKNLMGTTLVDKDINKKSKISRILYLESKKLI